MSAASRMLRKSHPPQPVEYVMPAGPFSPADVGHAGGGAPE